MRTLAQIISLTVMGRALKPRGGLKWLHKRHLLLKKRITWSSLPSSASFPEGPWVSSRFSSKFPSSLSNMLLVGGNFQVPAPAWAPPASDAVSLTSAICHQHRASADTTTADVSTVSALLSFSDSRSLPWPKRVAANTGLSSRLSRT